MHSIIAAKDNEKDIKILLYIERAKQINQNLYTHHDMCFKFGYLKKKGFISLNIELDTYFYYI